MCRSYSYWSTCFMTSRIWISVSLRRILYSPPICRSTIAWADPNRFWAVHTYSPVSSAASAGIVSTPPDTWWLYGRRPPRLDQEMVGGGEPVASHVRVTWLPTEAVRLCRSTKIVGLAVNVTKSRYYRRVSVKRLRFYTLCQCSRQGSHFFSLDLPLAWSGLHTTQKKENLE